MTRLKVALGVYPHTRALMDGSVVPDGFELDFVDMNGRIGRAFRRMVENVEFDVSEMAITTYISAKEFNAPFTAIAVFPLRGFPQRALSVNTEAGITDPRQLEGKRVGVRAYAVTTGVWARGVLSDQYGVDLDKITWVVADEENVPAAPLPGNVEFLRDADLGAMVSSGELVAGIGVTGPDAENVAPLVIDRAEKEAEWVAKGLYPINHTVVIKDSILDEHPEAARALYGAFVASKGLFMERLSSGVSLDEDERALANRRALVGPDPIPFGVEANRVALETIVGFARDQHILSKGLDVDEMFVPGSEV